MTINLLFIIFVLSFVLFRKDTNIPVHSQTDTNFSNHHVTSW